MVVSRTNCCTSNASVTAARAATRQDAGTAQSRRSSPTIVISSPTATRPPAYASTAEVSNTAATGLTPPRRAPRHAPPPANAAPRPAHPPEWADSAARASAAYGFRGRHARLAHHLLRGFSAHVRRQPSRGRRVLRSAARHTDQGTNQPYSGQRRWTRRMGSSTPAASAYSSTSGVVPTMPVPAGRVTPIPTSGARRDGSHRRPAGRPRVGTGSRLQRRRERGARAAATCSPPLHEAADASGAPGRRAADSAA
jgi:hypothetical protein